MILVCEELDVSVDPGHITAGGNFTLRCVSEAAETEVWWSKDGVNITSDFIIEKLSGSTTLLENSATLSHAGTYVCHGYSDKLTTKDITLVIYCKYIII